MDEPEQNTSPRTRDRVETGWHCCICRKEWRRNLAEQDHVNYLPRLKCED